MINIMKMNINAKSLNIKSGIVEASDCQKVYIDNMSTYYLYKNGGIKT